MQNIWVGIQKQNEEEKQNVAKLLLAVAYATKHHLRLKFGTNWDDFKDHLPEDFNEKENIVSES